MTTYAGINIDEATSARIYWGLGWMDSIDYEQMDIDAYGAEYIIKRAHEVQDDHPDKEVCVAFYKDIGEEDFEVLVDAPLSEGDPVTRFIVDERGNLRPVRG